MMVYVAINIEVFKTTGGHKREKAKDSTLENMYAYGSVREREVSMYDQEGIVREVGRQ